MSTDKTPTARICMDADLARLIHNATITALADCTPLQREAWLLTTGTPIEYDDDPAPPITPTEYARSRGIGKQAACDRVASAEVRVWREVSRQLLRRMGEMLDEHRDADAESVAIAATSTVTLDLTTAHDTLIRYGVRSEDRVHLGAGSEAHIRAGKHKGVRGTAARIAAHEVYSKPQSSD